RGRRDRLSDEAVPTGPRTGACARLAPAPERRSRRHMSGERGRVGTAMDDELDPHRVAALRMFSRALLGLVLLVGGLALAGLHLRGRQPHCDALKSVLPRRVAMNPFTALGFLLAAASLWLLEAEHQGPGRRVWMRRAAWVGAGSVAAIGIVTILGYMLGENLGLDQLLFRARLGGDRLAPDTPLNVHLVVRALL